MTFKPESPDDKWLRQKLQNVPAHPPTTRHSHTIILLYNNMYVRYEGKLHAIFNRRCEIRTADETNYIIEEDKL